MGPHISKFVDDFWPVTYPSQVDHQIRHITAFSKNKLTAKSANSCIFHSEEIPNEGSGSFFSHEVICRHFFEQKIVRAMGKNM